MTMGQTSQNVCQQRIPFGKPMLEAFCMDPEYTNLNARRFSCTLQSASHLECSRYIDEL